LSLLLLLLLSAGIDEGRIFRGFLPGDGRLLPLLDRLKVLALDRLRLGRLALPLFGLLLPFDRSVLPLFGFSELLLGFVPALRRDSVRFDGDFDPRSRLVQPSGGDALTLGRFSLYFRGVVGPLLRVIVPFSRLRRRLISMSRSLLPVRRHSLPLLRFGFPLTSLFVLKTFELLPG